MRKRDEITDPRSCLNKAHDHEWLFVLLGRDPAAIDAVRAWIEARVRLGRNARTDAKIVEAERWIETVKRETRAKCSGDTLTVSGE